MILKAELEIRIGVGLAPDRQLIAIEKINRCDKAGFAVEDRTFDERGHLREINKRAIVPRQDQALAHRTAVSVQPLPGCV